MSKLSSTVVLATIASAAVITPPIFSPSAVAETTAKTPPQLAQAALQQRRIPMIQVIGILNSTFRGTRLRLHNFRPSRGPRGPWHLPNASRLTLGPNLGGRTINFTIPEFASGRTRYYINDLNVTAVAVHQHHTAIQITLFFEGNGVEFKGMCAGGPMTCPVGNDSSRPDGHFDDGRLRITLMPAALNGSVSYDRVRVSLDGRFSIRGIGAPFSRFFDRIAKVKVQNVARQQLQQLPPRQAVARALRPLLDSYGVGQVVMVFIHRNDLVVIHRPTAPRT